VGWALVLGNPLLYVLWTYLAPQPFESAALRGVTALGGAVLLALRGDGETPPSRLAVRAYAAILWVALPLFFFLMYVLNRGNTVWVTSVACMFLIYYQLTDWRLATAGSVAALAGVGVAAIGLGVPLPDALSRTNVVPLAFAWLTAIAMGLSVADLRAREVRRALATMGIMAHEMRTPLASIQILARAIRQQDAAAHDRLVAISTRIEAAVQRLNRHIDSQIRNARLERETSARELLHAGELVRSVVAEYPYRNEMERQCVVVHVAQDFAFSASRTLLCQVVENLMKNALRSISLAGTSAEGALKIEVGITATRGRISFTDAGVGISSAIRARLFQPFVSSHPRGGHGLGLAFCKGVVEGIGGRILVRSELGAGAEFTLDLPAG
jgi:two-component system CAI-1 autoinducer sensor kinase/phosphatase CqsS